jgi:hypothetical protein
LEKLSSHKVFAASFAWFFAKSMAVDVILLTAQALAKVNGSAMLRNEQRWRGTGRGIGIVEGHFNSVQRCLSLYALTTENRLEILVSAQPATLSVSTEARNYLAQ